MCREVQSGAERRSPKGPDRLFLRAEAGKALGRARLCRAVTQEIGRLAGTLALPSWDALANAHHKNQPPLKGQAGKTAEYAEAKARRRLRDRETVPFKIATKSSNITKAFLLQWFMASMLLVGTEVGTEKLWWQVLRAEARAELPAKAGTLTIHVSIRPKGCYAVGKRVEAQSASRVGARQAGPSADIA